MTVLGLAVFGVTLFGALAALLQWKHRRALNAARLNRGLREYLAAKDGKQPTEGLTALQQG